MAERRVGDDGSNNEVGTAARFARIPRNAALNPIRAAASCIHIKILHINVVYSYSSN